MRLTVEALEDLARGAAFLGAGGGGDPYIGYLLARRAIEAHGPVEVIGVDQLGEEDAVYVVGMMGAPTVLIEKLPGEREIEIAVETLERFTGRRARAVLPIEVGGVNSLIPIQVAAARGLPLLDADGMGRAFPRLHMVTYHLHGIDAGPLVMVNEHGEFALIGAESPQTAEEMARPIAVRMGGTAAVSCYPMTGRQARGAVLPGTLGLARDLGRAIEAGRRNGDPFEALMAALRTTDYYRHCRLLFEGKITDLVRKTEQAFAIGRCRMAGLDGCAGGELEVAFQNEFLVARLDGEVQAIVPDLICILDRDSAEPITTENLRYGQRVKVFGVSAPPPLRTTRGLEIFGPQAFDLDDPFRPVEDLIPQAEGA